MKFHSRTRMVSPIFRGSKWPRSLSSSGRFTFYEIASHDNETTCNRPARAPTPSANTGNLCKRLNAIVPTIEKHHEPRSSSTHFVPRYGSFHWFPLLCIIIIVVVDAKRLTSVGARLSERFILEKSAQDLTNAYLVR